MTNIYIMDNKQEESEATVLLERYDLVPLLELGEKNPIIRV